MEESEKIPYTNFEIDESNMKPKKITNDQLMKIKQKHDQKDEELLNQLSGQAKQIKEGQKMISHVIKSQEPLLDNIHEDFDHVERKMKMENNKLKAYLEKTSTNCLYWVIGIELLILFFFFMM
jgi:vacuolar-type H+-ATPase subunit I/STV1